MEYKTVKEIDEKWLEYDKCVAETHLANWGKIFVDPVYGQPIDDELELEEIVKNEKPDSDQAERA